MSFSSELKKSNYSLSDQKIIKALHETMFYDFQELIEKHQLIFDKNFPVDKDWPDRHKVAFSEEISRLANSLIIGMARHHKEATNLTDEEIFKKHMATLEICVRQGLNISD